MNSVEIQALLTPLAQEFDCASPAEIRSIETAVQAQLPGRYVAFLETRGSSMFSCEVQVIAADGKALDLLTIFSASKVLGDLSDHADYAHSALVPFADDAFNNRYLLHAPSGRVSFIEYSQGQVRSVEVAQSFDDFLKAIAEVSGE